MLNRLRKLKNKLMSGKGEALRPLTFGVNIEHIEIIVVGGIDVIREAKEKLAVKKRSSRRRIRNKNNKRN